MYYFEILNTKTLEKAQGYANSMKEICESLDWKVRECKCIYRTNAGAE